MKSLGSLIFLILSMHVFGQDIPSTLKVIQIDDSLSLKTITTKIDTINSLNVKDSLAIIDIKAEHWETTVFNPFKNIEIKFPLQLAFTDSSYISPITRNKVVTSRYGWRKGRPHRGIDIDLITGDSILAMFDGIIRFAKYNTGHGRTVIVRHYNGLETVYAHLSRYAVKVNDTVKQGQLLGKGGTSGNARGSHLHLVINYKGIAINPEYLFDFNEGNTIRSKNIWVTNYWTRPYLHNSRRQSKRDILLTEDEAIASLKNQKRIYVVQRGDTLSKISLKNNVSIAAICKTNYIKRNAIIKIGQKLVIE
ncbi:MAG: peptidoglycan DD-metalloendopeptidase family protein [Bacteroidetes bacterium]|nr:peptidoglycan DD-metalloendopeptidase family protein [Bacteroidota bacterium]